MNRNAFKNEINKKNDKTIKEKDLEKNKDEKREHNPSDDLKMKIHRFS